MKRCTGSLRKSADAFKRAGFDVYIKDRNVYDSDGNILTNGWEDILVAMSEKFIQTMVELHKKQHGKNSNTL